MTAQTITPFFARDGAELYHGDCLSILPGIPSASVDCVLTDPPYPCIKREYGYWTEAEWFTLMRQVVPECMRVLKPTGSAVFILQPNSERVGRMRTWLWEFMLWVGKEWGIVQDAYWWNHETLPRTRQDPDLLRPSLKPCVWIGPAHCYRNGSAVVWEESQGNRAARLAERCTNRLQSRTSGVTMRDRRARTACVKRDGVTSFNVLPFGVDGKNGKNTHSARTPLALCSWWTRYLCPPGGTILDPFAGSGTTGIAALKHGAAYIGIERNERYISIARDRLAPLNAETDATLDFG